MRTTLVLCVLFFSLAVSGQSQRFKFDFESRRTLPTFVPFQTEYEVFENPDPSGINTSLLVGRVKKKPGKSLVWSGVFTKTPFEVDLSDGGEFRLKVYSNKAGGIVQVKFEDKTYSHIAYSQVKTTKANQWEELILKFTGQEEGSFTKLVIIFDLFSIDDTVYYFDDLRWIGGKARESY